MKKITLEDATAAYKALNLSIPSVLKQYSDKDIRKAFRKKALLCHPDKLEKSENKEFLVLINSYNLLLDSKNRQECDALFELSKQNKVIDNKKSELLLKHNLNLKMRREQLAIQKKQKTIRFNALQKQRLEAKKQLILKYKAAIDKQNEDETDSERENYVLQKFKEYLINTLK